MKLSLMRDIKNNCALKKVENIHLDIFDFFLYALIILCSGNHSPPTSVQFEFGKLNGGKKMEDNAKCFIKIRKGYYEEITYKELKERRENDNTYINKKFIPIQKTLIEVSLEEYKDFYKEIERNKYIKKKNKKIKFISIDEISEDMEIREKNILKDKDIDIDFEVERKIEIEQLKEALLQLNDEEYQIIKALFYDEKSLRDYAKVIGVSYGTVLYKERKILEKLKKLLKY